MPQDRDRQDLSEELKAKIAQKVKDQMEARNPPGVLGTVAAMDMSPFGAVPYNKNDLPRPDHPYVLAIELLDDGMVVRYSCPVKKEITVAGDAGFSLSRNPSIRLFLEGIAEALGAEDEEWNEDSPKGKIAKTMEKLSALSAPRKEERYFYETRSSVCKTTKEFETALGSARECQKLIKDLKNKGEKIHYEHPGDFYVTGA